MIQKILFVVLFFSIACLSGESTSPDPEILKKIVSQLEKNDEIAESYDFHQDSQVKDLNDDGKVEKVEKRTHRTILLEGQRYFELIKFDDKELDKDRKKEEAKNREKFLKEIRKKEKPSDEEDDFTWAELMEKYEFTHLPPEENAAYVISFKPRSGKLKERNRTEKIVNRLAGTLWISSDYNLIKVAANLTSAVKYGLGVLANVEEMHLKYGQTRVGEVWLPETFTLHYKARLFVKKRIREVQTRYYNLTKRSSNAAVPPAELN